VPTATPKIALIMTQGARHAADKEPKFMIGAGEGRRRKK
jgi:hypothetical protein